MKEEKEILAVDTAIGNKSLKKRMILQRAHTPTAKKKEIYMQTQLTFFAIQDGLK